LGAARALELMFTLWQVFVFHLAIIWFCSSAYDDEHLN
jgi:hypothetical protein